MANTIERIAHPIIERNNVDLGSFAFKAILEAEHLEGLQVPGMEVEVGDKNNPYNQDVSIDEKHRYTWDS